MQDHRASLCSTHSKTRTPSLCSSCLRRLLSNSRRLRLQRLELLLHQPMRRLAVAHFESVQDKESAMEAALSELSRSRELLSSHQSVFLSFNYPTAASNAGRERSRFEDNDELKYSLRSVIRFAPWLRRVYLVTNGQVPNWLNLSNPRLTVVTHEEIFPNKSHLPTFNGPAIESHLHRIPGLSEHFLYFNDDVFLTRPVHPHDFYSPAGGYRIFQSWEVPNCAPGCPHTWVADSSCDLPCNTSHCDFDGGDCLNAQLPVGRWLMPNLANLGAAAGLFRVGGADLCAPGCLNGWLADGFCDRVCDRPECGHDSGDCGTERLEVLVAAGGNNGTQWCQSGSANLTVPPGLSYLALNLSSLWPGSANEMYGSYESSPVVRSANFYHRWRTLHLSMLVAAPSSTADGGAKMARLQLRPSGRTACSVLVHFSAGDPQPPPTLDTSALENAVSDSGIGVQGSATSPRLLDDDEAKLIKLLASVFPELNSSQPFADTDNGTAAGLQEEPIVPSLERLLTVLPSFHSSALVDNWRLQTTAQPASSTLPQPQPPLHLPQVFDSKDGGVNMYDESLKYTNRVLSGTFGYTARKVPAHMPHFINSVAMRQLQNRFGAEYAATSSHRFRAKDDMQFSFAYYSFLVHQLQNLSLNFALHGLDRNGNGLLDQFEYRFALVKVAKETPVSEDSMKISVQKFLSLCVYNSSADWDGAANGTEPLQWKSEPLEQLENCTWLQSMARNATEKQPMYSYQLVDDSSVWFKMLTANFESTYSHLQEVIHEPRKFLCLNDDINYTDPGGILVRRLLSSFLSSYYPVQSEFELSDNATNRLGRPSLQNGQRTLPTSETESTPVWLLPRIPTGAMAAVVISVMLLGLLALVVCLRTGRRFRWVKRCCTKTGRAVFWWSSSARRNISRSSNLRRILDA